MKENLKYENHLGEIIDFKSNPYLYLNENDMRDFAWSFSSENDTISGFTRTGVVSKKLKATVAAPPEVADSIKNSIFEIAEKDVIAKQNSEENAAGKIWCGDYYLKCYIVGSSKSLYLKTKRITQFDLSVVTDELAWIKEIGQKIIPLQSTGGFDFPFEFPVDMANSLTSYTIYQKHFQPVNFRMEIPAIEDEIVNPAVIIGGNRYQVNVTVQVNHKLVIDSLLGKVYLENEYGAKTPAFHYRNRNYNIFKKINSGEQQVQWDNERSFPFLLTMYLERSEPEWN